jgi:hypothetical protein
MANGETQLDRIEKMLQALVAWKDGDGSVDRPGINLRVDRLEQRMEASAQKRQAISGWAISLFCGLGTSAALLISQLFHAGVGH